MVVLVLLLLHWHLPGVALEVRLAPGVEIVGKVIAVQAHLSHLEMWGWRSEKSIGPALFSMNQATITTTMMMMIGDDDSEVENRSEVGGQSLVASLSGQPGEERVGIESASATKSRTGLDCTGRSGEQIVPLAQCSAAH